MQYWLMKSEPDVFGIDHLINTSKQTEPWDGIRNYQARNFMRDEMKKGDLAFFYHSNCKVPGVVGIMEIVKESYVDPTQFDKTLKYYDPKSTFDKPRWLLVDVRYKRKFKNIVSLTALKANPQLASMQLVKKGNRLSILPINHEQWTIINQMEGI